MDTPPPPWDCRVRAIGWVHRPAPGARAALPAYLQSSGTLPLAAGALLRYTDSPVGPYAEVLATPVLLRGRVPLGHVPFIAVDSVPSLHGGRDHWALPKTLARFSPHDEHDEQDEHDGEVEGDGWRLRVRAATKGPRLPVVLRFAFTQVAHTRASCSFRGRLRAARVELRGEGVPEWLATGSHLGAVATGQLRVGTPAAA